MGVELEGEGKTVDHNVVLVCRVPGFDTPPSFCHARLHTCVKHVVARRVPIVINSPPAARAWWRCDPIR
jgi:hypothetical protein